VIRNPVYDESGIAIPAWKRCEAGPPFTRSLRHADEEDYLIAYRDRSRIEGADDLKVRLGRLHVAGTQ
jgi:hypothetical protein